MKMIAFISFPATVGLLILNRPIVQVLFQRGVFDSQSTRMTASCLLFFSLGIPFISGVRVLAPAFYSLKDTKTPVIVAFFITIVYVSLSVLLMKPMRVSGIALALSLSSMINFGSLFFLLERKIGPFRNREVGLFALKSALIAGVMGAGVGYFFQQFAFARMVFIRQMLVLLGAVAAGAVIYIGLNLLFSHEDLRGLKEVFSRDDIEQGRGMK